MNFKLLEILEIEKNISNRIDNKIKRDKKDGIYYVRRNIFFLSLLPSTFIVILFGSLGYSSAFSYVFAGFFYFLTRVILAYRNLLKKNKAKAEINNETIQPLDNEEIKEEVLEQQSTQDLIEIEDEEPSHEESRKELYIKRILEKQKNGAGEL